MASSIFIIEGSGGDVLLEKHYKGAAGRASVELFWEEVSKRAKRDDVPPIIVTSKYYLVNIYRSGLYCMATVPSEVAALSIIEFLHRLFDIFGDYFGEVTAKAFRDNFSTAYQLLEEMLDNGHPMVTEPNALHSLIAPPSIIGRVANFVTGKASNVSDTLGEGAMSIIPWRASGVKYAQNEIFFDIVEEVDCIYESNGTVVTTDIRGTIRCNSRMSGVPDLTLLFSAPGLIEDCAFHPCVRYARWEREQVVSFIPPDGPFVLMTYRVADRSAQTPVYCRPGVSWRDGIGRASFAIGVRPISTRSAGGAGGGLVPASELAVEDVKLTIAFPRAVKSSDLSSDTGSTCADPRTGELAWSMSRLPKDKSPELAGILHLAPGAAAAPIEPVSATLDFTVPNNTLSGLGVKDLLLAGTEKYKFFKGVRTFLKSGRVQIRT